MGIGQIIMDITTPILELIEPIIPGEIFPYFFTIFPCRVRYF